jgi:hypothetical protein
LKGFTRRRVCANLGFLEGDDATDALIDRFINRAHPAVPKFTHDKIAVLQRGFWSQHQDLSKGTLLERWLCHSDARQVFDLPTANPSFSHGLRPVIDRQIHKALFGKSETCRPSAWQSHNPCTLTRVHSIGTGRNLSQVLLNALQLAA